MRLQRLQGEARANPVLPLDVEELARAAGAIPLYVAEALEALQSAGAVAVAPDSVTVRDFGRLAEIGDFDPGYVAITHGG